MRTRPKPGQTKVERAAALAARSNAMAAAIEVLVKHLKDPDHIDEPRVWEFGEFSEEETWSIFALAHKEVEGGAFDFDKFAKAMAKTRPVLARPRMTNKVIDLYRMLSQPEILKEIWGHWRARTGSAGRDPGFLAKALLVVTAALGISAHFDDNYEQLTGEPALRGNHDPPYDLANHRPTRLRVVFEWIEQKAAGLVGRRPQAFGMKCYPRACEQIRLIVEQGMNEGALTTAAYVATNIGLLKWLAVTYPQTCVRLGIDGMLIKAWVKQVGVQDAAGERRIRGQRAPNASARLIAGKRGGVDRFVRGYYLFALTDLATNLPVSWGLWPAGDTNSETKALRFLLNELELWPNCPTTHIVADRAWDITDSIKDCALRFGIHLIVGRDSSSWDAGPTPIPIWENDDIAAFDGKGNAYCRHDGLILRRKTYDFLNPERRKKAGLKPGQAALEGSGFRVIFECDPGCPGAKRRALHMSLDWGALSAHPHTANGREDLHTERLALYARRNSCEALFHALKLGHKLGLDSADRTHTNNEQTIETLLSLGLLLRTAFVVAHERLEQGAPHELPDDLLRALAGAR